MTTLPDLLRSPQNLSLSRVASHLEGLAPVDQYTLTCTLGRKQQVRLFELCAAAPPLTRDDFFPAATPIGTAVTHHGWNSLPLFRSWRTFTKPMAALPGTNELGGYNEGSTRRLIGPGYFICRPSHPEAVERGSWVVDYLRTPEQEPIDGWPAVIPNERGLQRFIFGGTRDYLRRVCDGVIIGMPYKGDKRLAFPFMLVRSH